MYGYHTIIITYQNRKEINIITPRLNRPYKSVNTYNVAIKCRVGGICYLKSYHGRNDGILARQEAVTMLSCLPRRYPYDSLCTQP